MTRHAAAPGLAAATLGYLANVACAAANKRLLMAHVAACVTAMARHAESPAVAAAGLGFLANEATAVANRAALTRHVPVVVAAMTRHAADESVAMCGVYLLHSLLESSVAASVDSGGLRRTEVGVAAVVRGAVTRHGHVDGGDVGRFGRQLLTVL